MRDVIDKLKASGPGLVAMGLGLFIAIFAPMHPEGAHAPMWVVEAAAAAFFLAGMGIVLRNFGASALGTLCGLGAGYVLVTPGLWLLFSGDAAQCSVSIPFISLLIPGSVDGVLCRGIFGAGALVALGIVLLLTWGAVRRRNAATSTPAGR